MSVEEEGIVDLSFGAHRRRRPVVVTFGPPTVQFLVAPPDPVRGESELFTAVASSPLGAEIAHYEWLLTQGARSLTGVGETLATALPTSGTWRVRLTVTDENGLKGVSERDILVR